MTATHDAEGATPDRSPDEAKTALGALDDLRAHEEAMIAADQVLAMQILQNQRLYRRALIVAQEDEDRVTAAKKRLADQLSYADRVHAELRELLDRVGAE